MTPMTQQSALVAYQPTQDERTWGLIAHVGALAALFIVPIIVLAVKGNESRWVRAHAIESLNFSITMTIGYAICVALVFVMIGVCLLVPLAVAAIVLHVLAGVAAFHGRAYRYPFALRLIKE